MGWRLVDTDIGDPYYVTAVDEAIAQARKEQQCPNTLHFYRRHPPTVSVGRARRIHDDVNIDECMNNHVNVIRRTSGGGTIFTDKQCLIYSLIFHQEQTSYNSPQEIFLNTCETIVQMFDSYNIPCTYKAPNDILLNGKKISGSAQIKKGQIVLIHGTILVDTNLELMKKVLKKYSENSITTLRKEYKTIPSMTDLKKQLQTAFETQFNDTIVEKPLTDYENALIKKLLADKFKNDTWNFIR